ncbi:MAG: hypothetical protein AMJ81_06235 [Phycisphaerae bacterium SM23_33]|nr:MAG: hypothetical protein AMJ81_06235 [Phycisphaerae bacterium SM23_33]
MPPGPASTADAAFAGQMARREIVFLQPAPFWQNGLCIGNGDLGGAVFGGGPETGGVIAVTLNKTDLWDHRYDRQGHRYHRLTELRQLIARHAGTEAGRRKLDQLEPYGVVGPPGSHQKTYPYAYSPPTPKPVGIVRVDPGQVFEKFRCRLSIHRAEVEFTLGDPTQGARVWVFIDANSNVFAVRVQRSGTFNRPITVELARYVDDQLGEPEVQAQAESLRIRYVFPDGFTYAACGVVAEAQAAQAGTAGGVWREVQAQTASPPTPPKPPSSWASPPARKPPTPPPARGTSRRPRPNAAGKDSAPITSRGGTRSGGARRCCCTTASSRASGTRASTCWPASRAGASCPPSCRRVITCPTAAGMGRCTPTTTCR